MSSFKTLDAQLSIAVGVLDDALDTIDRAEINRVDPRLYKTLNDLKYDLMQVRDKYQALERHCNKYHRGLSHDLP